MWKNVGYYNGEMGPLEEMKVPMNDRALYFGDGIYEAKVTVDPSFSYLVETRVIDGVKYLLIPAGSDVEVNGLPVQVGGTPEEAE